MESLLTALTTAFTSISTNIMTAMGDVLPIALGIVGAVLVITFAIKFFKRITGNGNR